MLRVAVLISGAGSNLRALIDAVGEPGFPAQIVAVGADRDASGLHHAEQAGIPSFTVAYRDFESRDAWGSALIDALAEHDADVVVLSGLMRLLPAHVVEALAPNIINTHPAYLPEFPGAHAVRDALGAGAAQTGASIIVVDSGVDTGSIIVRERVDIRSDDTEHTLHERIKPVERRLLIECVRDIAEGRVDLSSPATISR